MITVPKVRRFSVEDYHRLIDLGFFGDNDRIELVQGELVEMAAQGTKHIFCCQALSERFHVLLYQKAISYCQAPILLSPSSEPEPDLTILKLDPDRYRNRKPEASDVLMVIEVADSSLDYDRRVKGQLYAQAGIEHYWIFNVLDRQLETFQSPQQLPNGLFQYTNSQIYLPSQMVILPAPLVGTLDLLEVLP